MAIAIVKSLDKDNLELKDPLPIYGQIRLWIDTEPPTPTNIWVVVGDFKITDSTALISAKAVDSLVINEKLFSILEKAKVQLTDYGIEKRRSFHADIRVPKELIDGYTG